MLKIGVRDMETLSSLDEIREVRYFECFDEVFMDVKYLSDLELLFYMNSLKNSRNTDLIINGNIELLRLEFKESLQMQTRNLTSTNNEKLNYNKQLSNAVLSAFNRFDEETLRLFLFNISKGYLESALKILEQEAQ